MYRIDIGDLETEAKKLKVCDI